MAARSCRRRVARKATACSTVPCWWERRNHQRSVSLATAEFHLPYPDLERLREMTDVVDRATRSRMMSRIRGKNTKPELSLRRSLHRLGLRFRIHVGKLP